MRALALTMVLLLTGCAAEPALPSPSPTPSPSQPPTPSPAPTPSPSPSQPPTPSPAPTPPERMVVSNGSFEGLPIAAKRTTEIVFLLNATDRVLVNLIFGAVEKEAPYGWSAQVSLRSPDGRIVADSGTSMPESGAAFQLRLRDLARPDQPGEFLVRATASHPTTLSGKAYVDAAAP